MRFTTLALVIAIGSATAGSARAGDITLSPTRIVFEGTDREKEVSLVNASTEDASYRISLKNLRQLRDGSYEKITTETSQTGELFASNLVRLSPRNVVLPANTRQSVRLILRKPKGLKPGEYRTHLTFTSAATPYQNVDTGELGKKRKVRVGLNMVYEISIPVIVREGKLTATANVSNLHITSHDTAGRPTEVGLTLNRKGTKSIYGVVRVTYRGFKELDDTLVGEATNVKLYPPGEAIDMKVPINLAQGARWQNGLIKVTFTDLEDQTIKGEAQIRLKPGT